ncbi:hypothetical protein OGAPHI_001846 [Ogataea philodendri]|uniref:F-box domain-containing protein n=1 Tax=Ogataea philodendri TaxID=1378263 RepID=A0A9P8PA41_9ASCO|nr:uncharacterized protein OGAPHI_001846 [Ogataea philodendri]KAH3668092.1 hypothetical protein OGAPHI_001846 [Ogataea philodendri]
MGLGIKRQKPDALDNIAPNSLAGLPKELLDKILAYTEARDYISVLLSCKTIYQKCHLTVFGLKPLRLQYVGRKGDFRYNWNLQTTWNLLVHMAENPEIYAQIKIFQLKNDISIREFQKTHKDLKHHSRRDKVRDPVVNYHEIPKNLILVLPKFVNLRYLKVDVGDFIFLRNLLEALPAKLKGLQININVSHPDFSPKKAQTPKLRCKGLKSLTICSSGKAPMIYGKLKSRHVMKVPSRYLIEETTFSNLIKQKFENDDKSIKKQPYLKFFGEMMAQLVETNSATLYSIDIRGMDAMLVFLSGNMDKPMPNLRVIKLCNLSIPRLNWWLPSLEHLNSNKRLFLSGNTSLVLPPIVVIFSRLFNPMGSSNNSYCRARFFGDPEHQWFSMGGEAKRFWEEIYYH